MKSGLVVFLALSLAGNAVLLGMRFREGVKDPSVHEKGMDTSLTGGRDAAGGSIPGRDSLEQDATDRTKSADAGDERQDLWSQLNFEDLASVVAKLRAAGMREEDVRALVSALVRERYKSRMDAVRNSGSNRPFWKSGRGFGGYSSEARSEMRAMQVEIDGLITSLVGDVSPDDAAIYWNRKRFGPLPAEKVMALQRIESDYNDLSWQLREGTGFGPRMPWEREQQRFLEAEKQRDVAALLTPAEQEMFDLYSSRSATALRGKLAGFEPTEAEFRALYSLQRAFDETYGDGSEPGTPEEQRARSQAAPELDNQFKQMLGESRYRDYQRASDASFQTALRLTQRLKLPEANATAVYDLSRDMQDRAASLKSDTSLSASERSTALAALSAEAGQRLSTLLTAQGAEAFKSRSGWLRSLESTGDRP